MRLASRVVAVLLITVLFFSFSSVLPKKTATTVVYAKQDAFHQSESVFIDIRNNSAFIDYGWSGTGTEIDPFVLTNQAIGNLEDYGYLQIRGTDAYFVIRNCYLLLMDIFFGSLSNGMIEDCTSINSTITIFDSMDCSLIGNDFSFSSYGEESIWMQNTSSCEIRENEFKNGHIGIRLYESNDTIISDNIFTGCIGGAILGDYASTTLTNNIFDGTGLRMDFFDPRIAYDPPIIHDNLVNGKDLGFFFNLVDAEIDGEQYGQIILGNCTETIITEGTLINCSTGVQIISCSDCTVIGTVVADCSWRGVTVERSNKTRIIDCHISNCDEQGIWLSVSPFYTIDNCTIQDNVGGIYPHIYSNNGTIVNCTIRGNKFVSRDYIALVAGIHLSTNSTVIGNTITDNNIGIFIYGAHCLVVYNVITHNGYGIYIGEALTGYGESPRYNRIYGNEIGWNYFANAYEYLTTNQWDDGISIGNSWSDYYGIGYYEICPGSIDHFPKLLPEGGVSLFLIHVGVGISSSIIVVVMIVVILKRRSKNIE